MPFIRKAFFFTQKDTKQSLSITMVFDRLKQKLNKMTHYSHFFPDEFLPAMPAKGLIFNMAKSNEPRLISSELVRLVN